MELLLSWKKYLSSAVYRVLRQIHKPTLSLRPIIASYDSSFTILTMFFTEIFSKSYNYSNEYYIADSFERSS